MFNVPQPTLPEDSDVVDGRPIVRVSDSAHDFKQLLHLLYDGVKFMPPDHWQPVAFSILAAVTRLGHKHHIEWILEGAKRRLKSIFTTCGPGMKGPLSIYPANTESDHTGRGPQHVPGRDPDFWFEDGNVVAISDSTSFPIHRSVLARHSGILTNRSISDQGHRENTSDGGPVVRVADSARSFKGLLSLLHPGPVLRQVTSDRVLARVTHKRLHSLLHSTFDEWRRREDRTLSNGPASTRTHSSPPNDSENMIGVLNALRQIQGDDLLLIALYLCAQLPPRVLVPGRHSCDGAVEVLSSADVELCLLLREDTVKQSARMAMRLFADAPDPRCRCRRAVEETFAAAVNGEFEDAPRTDPFGAYWRRCIDGVERSVQGDKRVCSRCAYALRQRDLEQRRELWDELPKMVGF